MLPEVAELGHLPAGDIVGHRHARQFDDAALDGIHERKVAHGPGKQGALSVARAAQEERRGRQVDHTGHTEFTRHHLQAGDPDARRLVVLLGLLSVVALQIAVVFFPWLLAIAMVGFVVDDQDVFQAHEFRHDALQHLPLGFERVQRLTPTLEQARPPLESSSRSRSLKAW